VDADADADAADADVDADAETDADADAALDEAEALVESIPKMPTSPCMAPSSSAWAGLGAGGSPLLVLAAVATAWE